MLNLVANGPSGYNLTNSLRFRSSASAYLNRTPSSSGNLQKWTVSFWYKKTQTGGSADILNAYVNTSQNTEVRFNSSDQLIFAYTGALAGLVSTQVFRDYSSWYHIVLVWDSANATAAYRMRVYVNGNEITSWATDNRASISSNSSAWNSTAAHYFMLGNGAYVDGYMAEFYNIDGQALTPSSFGSTNATTGVWQPAKYTGTYGTNGFYLPFTDNSALTTSSNVGLGKDFSGNSNYWVTNNISITAGTTYDSMKDVPTLTSATVANYAVMNPLSSASGTLTNGNLTFSNAGAVKGAMGTFGLESGKWYWENTITTLGANDLGVGILFNNATAGMRDGTSTSTYSVFYQANTNVRKNGTIVANYASYTTGDIIGIAYNADTLQITFYKNNVSQGTITADSPSSPYVVWIIQPNTITATVNANFGQQPFTYTPPTGYVALNTYNLPTSTIVQGNKYMDATLWTGNGTTQTITNSASFKPDFVWIKRRNIAADHVLYDSVRTLGVALSSSLTSAEPAATNGLLTAFNSNGFGVAVVTGDNSTNGSTQTYVGWQWQAGQGSTSSGTGTGGITSVTQSVNTTAGFSIVTYTGSGANGTVTHGLGVAPKMVIVKNRSAAQEWLVYHSNMSATPATVYMPLNSTAAASSTTTAWNSTAPTSSVFSVGTAASANGSGNSMVAYCWAEIAGFSKFGSYVGNGSSDGPFTYLGFRPKFVMVKNTSTAGYNWVILDSSRDTYNYCHLELYPNTSGAEVNASSLYQEDFLSNGFKIRQTDATWNANGSTYIYAAFAENPFKNALAR